MRILLPLLALAVTGLPLAALDVVFDPASANGIVTYQVPADFPNRILVKAEFKLDGENAWRVAALHPRRSETAVTILAQSDPGQFAQEQNDGFVETLAAGRTRTAGWLTARQLPMGRQCRGELRLTLRDAATPEKILRQETSPFAGDFSKVVMLDRFAGNPDIYPPAVAPEKRDNPGWYQTADGLEAFEKEDLIEPLAWRPRLKGYYAIYLAVPQTGYGEIEVELTGDGFAQRFAGFDGFEYRWKAARLDGVHLVIRQPYRTLVQVGDKLIARLGYVKLVPISEAEFRVMTQADALPHDKTVIGYFEPYSWAFRELVSRESDFLGALTAFRAAGFDWVDAQVGRAGARPQYPSAVDEPLLGETRGDAAPGSHVAPTSQGTGRMVRLIDPVRAVDRAAKTCDLMASINFGAANNYLGGPLESEFSKAHPECFTDRFYLKYSDPAARAYFLQFYRDVLERGARRISLDFCRYPHGVKTAEDANAFLRELRKLADEFSTPERRIEILVRFPVPGNKDVALNRGKFDPECWVREGLVDVLVPSDFGGMPFFDAAPYVAMTRGTRVRAIPCIDALGSGRPFPGNVLNRAAELYRQGADGVYLYQADAHVVGSMTARRDVDADTIRLLGNSKAVAAAVAREKALQDDYSFGIYVSFPSPYNSSRVLFWIDGCEPERVDMYIDGKLISSRTQPPWMLGEMGYANHYEFLGKDKPGYLIIKLKNREWRYDFVLKQVLRASSF